MLQTKIVAIDKMIVDNAIEAGYIQAEDYGRILSNIFEKSYSEEEYNELVPKIIEHMKGGGEWGEFFPISHSPFGYNETGYSGVLQTLPL